MIIFYHILHINAKEKTVKKIKVNLIKKCKLCGNKCVYTSFKNVDLCKSCFENVNKTNAITYLKNKFYFLSAISLWLAIGEVSVYLIYMHIQWYIERT